MVSYSNSTEELLRALAELPEEDIESVRQFVDFLRFKSQQRKIVRLGGLWKDLPPVTEQDIQDIRREMWGKFGEREL